MFTKKIKKVFIGSLSILLIPAWLFGSSSLLDKSNEYLENATNNYLKNNLTEALNDVNLATDYQTTADALYFKTLLEYSMGNSISANKTLEVFKTRFPKDGRVYTLSATMLSLEYKNGEEILSNIQKALSLSSESGQESILSIIEQTDAFEYFRVVCKDQYNHLLANVDKMNLDTSNKQCRENKTKVENVPKLFKYKVWISNADCAKVKDGVWVANVLLKAVPQPAKGILTTALKIRNAEIQAKNKSGGCGVVLHYSYFSGILGFWVTKQV